MLLPVLREAFLGDASSARLGVPRVGLSDLYAGPAADYLDGRRCTVRLRSPVRGLLIDRGRCGGVILAGGERLEAGAVISSVPHADLPALLPDSLVDDPVFARAARLETSPIVSVYLWFDVPVIDLPFAALVGGMWQWVFDRDHISGGGNGTHGVTLVCSAAYDLVDRPVETLIRSALDELRQFVPSVRRASLRRSMVIKEKKATISPACGTADLRPDQRTPCEALYLAGDWTATGLPATIEGAVLSGHRCARAAAGIDVS
jgi:phytoene dehydrogenase-like protein